MDIYSVLYFLIVIVTTIVSGMLWKKFKLFSEHRGDFLFSFLTAYVICLLSVFWPILYIGLLLYSLFKLGTKLVKD
jgi:hypothetical protein